MFDFHININDALKPAKVIQYAKLRGLRAFALFCSSDYIFHFEQTDLKNFSEKRKQEIFNSDHHLQKLLNLKKQIHTLSIYYDIQAFFGIKLSFLPPALLEQTIQIYRDFGFNLIGVQGENFDNIVELGTNFAACNAKADILFAPGLIDEQTIELAAKNQTYLEISTSKASAYCNAHIAKLAQKFNAKLIVGSNANNFEEIHSPEIQKIICQGACINLNDMHNHELYAKLLQNNAKETV